MSRLRLRLLALGLLSAASAGAAEPQAVNVAGVLYDGVESAWEKSLVDSFHRVVAARPHGLSIGFDYTEHVGTEQAEQVIRDYADSGRYQIIFTDSAYADAIERVHDEYPELLFVFAGAGNHGVGGNAYWVTIHQHETGWLMGVLAGRLTRSGVIGIVGTYPGDDTNDEINGFFAGASSVNPAVRRKLTFINAWYDPQKSAAATGALVAGGADFVLEQSPAFEACVAAKIGCFGNYVDFSALAPDAVVTSSLADWGPDIDYILDRWWAHAAQGAPYAAPMTATWFGMQAGALALAPWHGWEGRIPAAVKAEIDGLAADIAAGRKTIPLDLRAASAD